MNLTNHYGILLKNWIASARNYVASPYDRPDFAYYGTGTNVWGIQTHMKGFSAFAVYAADTQKPEDIDLALKMLRFTLESYIGGSYHCTDGDNVYWGHHWLASLAIERMMHGVDAISAYMTENDNRRLREVLISECDYLVDERAVQADPVSPNVPESNLWTGAILHRVSMMYPDAARIDEYRRHGTHLLLNSISVPSDKDSTDMYAGKPVRDWFVGANYFESYGLNHHGYMNVGYMVICLSNIAMLHFSCKKAGIAAPPELYRHFADLWKFVRTCIFDDGRLFRIGGDTRVRYCYCQDYLIPVFALVQDVLGEDMSGEENGWLSILDKETDENGDGSFLKIRCELFRERSQLYYTRLESDRACTLSMMWLWHRLFPEVFAKTEKSPKNQLWRDDYHGSHYVRGENRMAAFTWISAERPQGSIVPPTDSSMAESKFNMVSVLEGTGVRNFCRIIGHSGHLFDGGFITGGRFAYVTQDLLEENDNVNENAVNNLVYCALPDDRTVVTLQLCRTIRRCWVLKVKPLNYNMPNDMFNGNKRDYTEHDGALTIDGKLTFTPIYGGNMEVVHGTARTINIQHIGVLTNSIVYGDRGMLRVDEIRVSGASEIPQWYDKNTVLFDFAVAVRTDGNAVIAESYQNGDVRVVKVVGADGKKYIVTANFGTDTFDGENWFTVYEE